MRKRGQFLCTLHSNFSLPTFLCHTTCETTPECQAFASDNKNCWIYSQVRIPPAGRVHPSISYIVFPNNEFVNKTHVHHSTSAHTSSSSDYYNAGTKVSLVPDNDIGGVGYAAASPGFGPAMNPSTILDACDNVRHDAGWASQCDRCNTAGALKSNTPHAVN